MMTAVMADAEAKAAADPGIVRRGKTLHGCDCWAGLGNGRAVNEISGAARACPCRRGTAR